MRYFLGLLLLTPIAMGAIERETTPTDPKVLADNEKRRPKHLWLASRLSELRKRRYLVC